MAITNVNLGAHPLYLADTLGRIISFLPHEDLIRILQVCKDWERVTNQCWKNFLENRSTKYRFVEDFSSLVNEGVMTWKEAYRYSDLAVFFNKILSGEFERGSYAQAENPELKNKEFLSVRIPQPWICCGNTTYSIFNSSDIKVQKKSGSEFQTIKGKEGKRLTHLAIENHFLFALRDDGFIVQFNLLNDDQNEIPTSWALGQVKTQDPRFKICGPFCVQEGYIIMKYGDGRDRVFETIPYHNIEERKLNIDHNLPWPHRILVKQEKLYILGRNEILIWDLRESKRIQILPINMDSSCFAYDFALAYKVVFVVENKAWHLIHPETGMSLQKACENFYDITIIENLMIGRANDGIRVKNLNTGDHLIHIKEIFQSSAQSVSYAIKPEVLRQLVQICQQHCQKFVLTEDLNPPPDSSCAIL